MFSKKNLNSLILLLVFGFYSLAFAQTDFEGKVVMRISAEHSADVDYYIKENNMRMEMKSEKGTVVILYDQNSSKTQMIMPEQKMYMELPDMEYMKKNDVKTSDKSPNINRTGEMKEINGYNCEKWIIKNDDNEVEAWMTDGIGSFYMMSNPMSKSAQDSWQKELQGKYFPMKVDIMKNGEKKTSMEVVSVNKMSLNDDLFKVSKDFKKFDMPQMYKQN